MGEFIGLDRGRLKSNEERRRACSFGATGTSARAVSTGLHDVQPTKEKGYSHIFFGPVERRWSTLQ